MAMRAYGQALTLEPQAPGVDMYVGQIYAEQGNRDSALAVLGRVVAREPHNKRAREVLREFEAEGKSERVKE